MTFIFSVQNWILASDKTYFQALLESLHKAISNGELLMYAVAALGPLIQVSNKYSRDRTEKPFPNLRPILVVAFVVVSMATGLFFMTRNSSTSSHISIIAISAVIYFVSLMILFPLLAFDCEKMKNPSDALMQDESEFQDGYGAHRSSK